MKYLFSIKLQHRHNLSIGPGFFKTIIGCYRVLGLFHMRIIQKKVQVKNPRKRPLNRKRRRSGNSPIFPVRDQSDECPQTNIWLLLCCVAEKSFLQRQSKFPEAQSLAISGQKLADFRCYRTLDLIGFCWKSMCYRLENRHGNAFRKSAPGHHW